MKLYRYSPIKDIEELGKAIGYVHIMCLQLCRNTFGRTLPVAGNVGIFCHYEDEYERLIKFREQLTEPSINPDQKYFQLLEPIQIPTQDGLQQATYAHLYIRKPDVYRSQVGDVDFILPQEEYDELKATLLKGKRISGARIFPRNDLDMIELYDPDVDALGYVSPKEMTQKVRLKLSNETNL
jgi:hypothetical protein